MFFAAIARWLQAKKLVNNVLACLPRRMRNLDTMSRIRNNFVLAFSRHFRH